MKLSSDTIKIFDRLEPIEFTRMNFDIDLERAGRCAKYNHSHPFCELYFLIAGEIDYFAESNRIRLSADGIGSGSPGAVALTRGGELHHADVRRRDYDHAFFFFSEKSFPEFGESSPLECFFERERGEKNTFVPSIEVWQRMVELIEELTRLSESDSPVRHYTEYGLVLELVALVGSEWKRIFAVAEPFGKEPDPADNPIANRAASYITQNFRTIGSVAEVAVECGVTQSYLSRVFKQEFGMKPNEYLRRHRLESAKTMLLNGFDVTSTCYHAGFSDYSHFIQVFRTYEGLTPLAFQKSRGVLRNDISNPE